MIAYARPVFLATLNRGLADNLFVSSSCVIALLAGCAVFFGGADELGLSDLGVDIDIVPFCDLGDGVSSNKSFKVASSCHLKSLASHQLNPLIGPTLAAFFRLFVRFG